MKKLFSLSAFLAVFSLGVWFYFTPHLTLKSMKEAADGRNGEKLAGHVNFPLLRESLKARLNSRLSERASREGQINPLSGLSSALFAKMVDPLVEKMVTPDNLIAVIKGKSSAFPAGRPQSKPEPGTPDQREDHDQEKDEAAAKGTESGQDVSMSYEGFNRFSASITKTGSKDAPVTLLLQREGLASWKLVDISFSI